MPFPTLHIRRMKPDARMVLLEDASHQNHLEQEQAYLAVVRSFLA